ncbi:MAG: 2-oxoacid:acceptor oxidoreductase subunit alpha [candidate division Zixibacteria bacterium]|nr:2-oxoacid:acceptor oxidoreductase subunit alpha [candidate division Zixibacteria bacterium]
MNDLNLLIGGYAGQGVQTVATSFARLCTRAGLYAFVNLEYPSNIKGEHNYAHIMVSEENTGSQTSHIDLLLALDVKTVNEHINEIRPGGALIYDSQNLELSHIDIGLKLNPIERNDITVIDIPLADIAVELGGSKRMINSIGLGAVVGLLRLDFEHLAGMLRQTLSRFEDKIVKQNLEGARHGYDKTREEYSERFGVFLKERGAPNRMFLTGNDAVSMGAIKAGLKFYASYPMSPSSSVLGYLSKHAREYDIITMLPEDEISAIGLAIGASFAGARSMTGTSGGGFCLMTEYMGLAGMAEIPLVIFESQRPGPATGLPTRTEQGDLKFVLSAHQGDFPRIVITPGDPAEAYRYTFDAFNLADKYQTPVIVLSDKHLSESYWTYDLFNSDNMKIDRGQVHHENELSKLGAYKRYLITDSGISPRTLPGTPGGVFKSTGNAHTEYGLLTEDSESCVAQVDKRSRKIESYDVSEIGIKLHGDSRADITLVGWGSTKRVILDAISVLEKRQGVKCNFLQVIYMEPFPATRIADVLENSNHAVLIENNSTGQLGDIIRQNTGLKITDIILKYDGRQFLRDELVDRIETVLKSSPGAVL